MFNLCSCSVLLLPRVHPRSHPRIHNSQVTTPHGSGSTEKRTLGTEASEVSAVTDKRHLAHDFDKLVHEINIFNLATGLEHQGLVNDVRTLKNEVRGLAGLVRMRQSVATPAVLMVPQPHARRALSPTVLAATNRAGGTHQQPYTSQILITNSLDFIHEGIQEILRNAPVLLLSMPLTKRHWKPKGCNLQH